MNTEEKDKILGGIYVITLKLGCDILSQLKIIQEIV